MNKIKQYKKYIHKINGFELMKINRVYTKKEDKKETYFLRARKRRTTLERTIIEKRASAFLKLFFGVSNFFDPDRTARSKGKRTVLENVKEFYLLSTVDSNEPEVRKTHRNPQCPRPSYVISAPSNRHGNRDEIGLRKQPPCTV